MNDLRVTRCLICGELVLRDKRGASLDLPDPDGAPPLTFPHACHPGLREAKATYLAAVERAFPKGLTHADH